MFVFLEFLEFLHASSSDDDHSAAKTLLVFKEFDPLMKLHSWNASSSVCSWDGVSCSSKREVIGLQLRYLSPIPPSVLSTVVQGLPHLETLQISKSNFSSSIRNMSMHSCLLHTLDLSNNDLTGALPVRLLYDCKSLKLLNLSSNRFDEIPPSFFSTTCKLQVLDISHNHLTGVVPEEVIENCPDLQSIHLMNNFLSGAFPFLNTSTNNIRDLKLSSNLFTRAIIHAGDGCIHLTELDISNNNLSSQLFSFGKGSSPCTSLKILKISGNSFSGDLLSTLAGKDLRATYNLFKFFPSLEFIDASFNDFTGKVPFSIPVNLQYADFSSNRFTSAEDRFCIHNNSRFETLMLPNNKLAGQFFPSLANCSGLKLLDLSFNSLTEDIPENLCTNLPKLEYLLAWVNHLKGRIPSSLSACRNLKILQLGHNNLQGEIPSELARLEKLWWLSLINNKLTGRIPTPFKKLKLLQLSNNYLVGEIPPELEQCEELVAVNIGGNFLEGNIPRWIGRKNPGVELLNVENDTLVANLKFVLVAFFNNTPSALWTSLIPVQGISLQDLEMVLSDRLGRSIKLMYFPSIRWNITSPLILELSYNRLTGEIPAEIGHMMSMQSLFLEHNILTGTIPESLGSLSNLLYMDISQNNLQGGIPDSFAQLNFGYFNVSHNNISGTIPSVGKLATFPASSYQGNPGLCGSPLQQCTFGKNVSASLIDRKFHGKNNGDVFLASVVTGCLSFVIFTTLALLWEDKRTRSFEHFVQYYLDI